MNSSRVAASWIVSVVLLVGVGVVVSAAPATATPTATATAAVLANVIDAPPGHESYVGDFDSMVIDPVTEQVFTAAPSTGTIDIVPYDGYAQNLYPGFRAASHLAIAGTMVYVAEPLDGVIRAIPTDLTGPPPVVVSGLPVIHAMAYAGGRLWVAVASTTPGSDDLVSVNPTTGATTTFALQLKGTLLRTSPAEPDVLLFAVRGALPRTMTRYDVASGTPVPIVTRNVVGLAPLGDLVVAPNHTVIAAATDPTDGLVELSASDLMPTGTVYPLAGPATAVAATSSNGGLIAGASSTGAPAIRVFAPGSSTPILDIKLPAGATVQPRGLAFTPDGSRLFVVSRESPGAWAVTFRGIPMTGLSGRVMYQGSSGHVDGVKVDLTDAGGAVIATTTTDRTGVYHFGDPDVPAGSYRIHIHPLGATADAWYATGGSVQRREDATVLTYSPRQRVIADVDVPFAVNVRGHLINGHGTPLQGLVISGHANGTVVATTTTDAHGDFAVTGLWPATYTFSVVDPLWLSSAHTAGYHEEWIGQPGVAATSAGPALAVNGSYDYGTHMIASHDCDQRLFVPGASIDHQDLSGCELTGASLSGADASSTDFTAARVDHADLRKATFAGADLTQSTLLFARTGGATFNAAVWQDTICPDATNSDSHGQTCVGHLGFPAGGDGTPIGALDKLVESSGGVDFAGWALDPSTPDPITVRATANSVGVKDVVASNTIPNVGTLYPLYGPDHGFAFHLDMPYGGVYQVCAVAVNVADGGDKALGCIVVDRGAGNTWFNSLAPQRILDTRLGTGAPVAKVSATTPLRLHVLGHHGVAATQVSSVVLNITVTNPSTAAFVSVWPAGVARPQASNLNFGPGQTVANLVTVEVGLGGDVEIGVSAGAVDVIADIEGWYDDGTGAEGSTYVGISPDRLLDTRTGNGAPAGRLSPASPLTVQITGRGAVPASGVSAVIVNITVTNPTAGSYVTAWPAGSARPGVSNVNFGAGQTVPNLAIVKLSAGGALTLANAVGFTDVILDIEGWFDEGGTSAHAAFVSFAPVRLYDSRDAAFGPPEKLDDAHILRYDTSSLAAGRSVRIDSLVLNVTVTNPTLPSFLTAFPGATSIPTASNLNFGAGQTVPNLVTVRVSATGLVDLINAHGSTDVVIDLQGWYESPT